MHSIYCPAREYFPEVGSKPGERRWCRCIDWPDCGHPKFVPQRTAWLTRYGRFAIPFVGGFVVRNPNWPIFRK